MAGLPPTFTLSRRSGFTLLEMMVVVAIISILSAMAAMTAQEIGSRNAIQNAASDISTILQNARARAEQKGSDVYVIVYPRMTKAGALTGGKGALFVYEDYNGDFLTGSGACNSTVNDCSFASFTPPSAIYPLGSSKDKLVQALYLDDYPKQNVQFGKLSTLTWTLPFTSIGTSADTNGCTFCTSGKGVIVFTGEQQLRFLNNTGAPVAQRVAGLAVQGVLKPESTYLFGMVGATGLVTLVK